ncbi:uncharacterized protein L3040_000732 [Drepanopeziza brunnea f. sp. 'multigermtubi']|uniref:uncharacterized protein n=1 Tax=Drepanopeziza brunnea f. sp. 'multigermtubi' TaxID=698441 RepID=UPI0023A35280|nr:hypothetical protein L3040_000732 [Drepanopeziza brunnea f. sp. 'multigermtubi']
MPWIYTTEVPVLYGELKRIALRDGTPELTIHEVEELVEESKSKYAIVQPNKEDAWLQYWSEASVWANHVAVASYFSLMDSMKPFPGKRPYELTHNFAGNSTTESTLFPSPLSTSRDTITSDALLASISASLIPTVVSSAQFSAHHTKEKTEMEPSTSKDSQPLPSPVPAKSEGEKGKKERRRKKQSGALDMSNTPPSNTLPASPVLVTRRAQPPDLQHPPNARRQIAATLRPALEVIFANHTLTNAEAGYRPSAWDEERGLPMGAWKCLAPNAAKCIWGKGGEILGEVNRLLEGGAGVRLIVALQPLGPVSLYGPLLWIDIRFSYSPSDPDTIAARDWLQDFVIEFASNKGKSGTMLNEFTAWAQQNVPSQEIRKWLGKSLNGIMDQGRPSGRPSGR